MARETANSVSSQGREMCNGDCQAPTCTVNYKFPERDGLDLLGTFGGLFPKIIRG